MCQVHLQNRSDLKIRKTVENVFTRVQRTTIVNLAETCVVRTFLISTIVSYLCQFGELQCRYFQVQPNDTNQCYFASTVSKPFFEKDTSVLVRGRESFL